MPDMRRMALLFVAVFCLLLISCSRRPPASAESVLDSMRGAMGEDANSVVRMRGASPNSPMYLTDSLLSALYGSAARGWLDAEEGDTPLINDAALCLSASKKPYELAVFRCSDARGTATAAATCRARLAAIRRAWRGSEWVNELENSVVAVEGEYVLLVVAPDVDAVLEAARCSIRSGG